MIVLHPLANSVKQRSWRGLCASLFEHKNEIAIMPVLQRQHNHVFFRRTIFIKGAKTYLRCIAQAIYPHLSKAM